MKKNYKTLYLFPDKGLISVVEVPKGKLIDNYSFGLIEIELGGEDQDYFTEIHEMLRMSMAAAIAHTPSVIGDDNQADSNIVLSFHSSRLTAEDLDEPLMLVSLPVDTREDSEILTDYNEQMVLDGHFVVVVRLANFMMFIGIVEIFAIAPPYKDRKFRGSLSMCAGNLKYFSEFQPPLENSVEGVLFPMEHYRTETRPNPSDGAVDMTGLIPDGLA